MATRSTARAPGDWTVFATMSLVIAVVIAAGFGPSYARALAPPGLPFWVHLHGAVMATWIVLFAVQATLIRQRALPLHRALGWASLALVVVMLPLGLATDLLGIRRGATPPFFTPAEMLAADAVDLVAFAALFAWAVVRRRQAQWHKRLMLCATILLTLPALGRFVAHQGVGLHLIIPLATALLIALALVGPLVDLARGRAVHPAYLWGVGAIVAANLLHPVVAASGPVRRVAAAMLAPAAVIPPA